MTIQQSNYVKLVAITTMLIDHIGVILFPEQILFRVIGRISFPLFALQLSVGYENTGNFKRYVLRMLGFGIVIQLLYFCAVYVFKINEEPKDFNIFFTLALGLLSIYFYDKRKYIGLFAVLSAPLILKYFGASLDYGIYGVILILVMYVERNNRERLYVSMLIVTLLYVFLLEHGDYIQIFSLLALIFIIKPFSFKIRIPNYVFYLFYPVHIAVLYVINMLAR